jgi:hypothetical protein
VIPHFPDPYPGEAFFSVYARFCERLGLNGNSRTSRLFFGRSCRVSVQLPHGLDHVIGNLPLGHSHTADQLIDQNTLLPLFAPFIDSTRYQEVKSDMRGCGGVAVRLGLNSGGIRSPNWLRHCSVCDTENRDRFGETFWARLHQTSGVNICPVHRCFLEQTSVTRLSRGVFSAISAESVCRNTTPHYLDESDPDQRIQFRVARDAAWLLDINRRKPGPMALLKSYLFCAVNQGFVTNRGKFRQLNLHAAFIDRYDKELLRLLCLEFAEGKKPWLRRFFVLPTEIQYPIRHLIVMHFLGFTVAEFFDQLPEEEAQVEPGVRRQITDLIDAPLRGSEVFGTAPWPCRNPVSDCAGKLLIQECAERTTGGRGRTNYRKRIGDFVCPHCGFTYSRLGPSEGDSKRMVWIRDYGHAWKAELRKVWADHRYTIAQAASHLGVTAQVVRTQASLCGLVVPKPGQRMSQRAKDCRLRRRRTVRTFEPRPKSVDWAKRDTDLSRRVADAASTLFQAPGKPVRVTQSAIFRLLEDSSNLYCNRDKLPATVRSISKAVESEEQFVQRLLRHSVTEHRSAGLPLARWRLKCAVGYRRLKRFPSLRIEIDSLLSRSAGTYFPPVES